MNQKLIPGQVFPLLTLAALLVAAPVNATSVIAPTFEQMVASADLIFTGRATRQRSEWKAINGKRSIITWVTFEVAAVHKGAARGAIDLQFLGGTVDDATLEVDSMPKFQMGERVVLFVEKNGVNASPLPALYHGRFGLRTVAGGDVMLDHRGNELTDLDPAGRKKSTVSNRAASPMTHKEFARSIDRLLKTPTR